MAKEQLSMKNELTSLKDTLQQLEQPTQQDQDDLHTIQEFLEHQDSPRLRGPNNPKCAPLTD